VSFLHGCDASSHKIWSRYLYTIQSYWHFFQKFKMAAAATLDFQVLLIWPFRRVVNVVVLFCTKFGSNICYSQVIVISLRLTSNVESRRRLRSGSTSTLLMPSTRRATLGDRAFTVAAARARNALPSLVRTSSTYLAFVASWKHCYSRHPLKTGYDCAIYLLHSVNCKFWQRFVQCPCRIFLR